MIIYFLPAMIALGLITSYEDFRYGKVYNRWVILALIYAISVNLLLMLNNYLNQSLNVSYLVQYSANLALSVLTGYLLWHFNVWSAGDGKLFIAFSSLLPLSIYQVGFYKLFPAIAVLVNIFIPASIILLIMMLKDTKIRHLKKAVKKTMTDKFDFKELGKSILKLFAIYWIAELVLGLFGMGDDTLLRIIFTMGIFSMIPKKFEKLTFVAMTILTIVRVFVDPSVYTWQFWINFLILVFVWRLLRSFMKGSVANISREVFSEQVETKDLKPGMVCSDPFLKLEKVTHEQLTALKKKEGIEVITDKVHPGRYYVKDPESKAKTNLFEETAEGLTKKDIRIIQDLGFERVHICRKISFAPFIFLGIILTILFKGNILIAVALTFS